MAFQPGLPGSQFPSDDALIRRIQDVERSLRELAAANPFAPMGMTPAQGGVNITGNLAVTGTLSLPAGIINNDALANPVTGTVISGSAEGFALPQPGPATRATIINKTITVPAGFTRAHVLAFADMTAVNTTASGDYAYVRVKINGAWPTYLSGTYTVPGKFSYVGSNYTSIITGLGPSFDIGVEVQADSVAWPSSPNNVANLSAMVTFLR